jgi:surface polysaccharide O-acyltransferase-like enzyme
MSASTEPTTVRRGAIDIARSSSLVLVVVAHLTMVVLDRATDGSLRGVNIFELYPRFELLTMLSPMPLFFVASGWANVGGRAESRMTRTISLTALASVVGVAWSVAALIEGAATGGNGIVSDGARIATQPLWFLTAWVPFTACANALTRASRRIIPSIGACIAVLVITDVVRFVGGAPRWIGYPGFFAAWAVPWLIGAWWRQRHDSGSFDERRAGLVLVVGGLVVLIGLVRMFGYHPALIDAVPGHRSNTTPPTLFTAVAAMVQAGVFIVAARRLDAIAARRARAIGALDAIAPGIYVWHLTALSLWGAALAAGLWAPVRLSAAWWTTRPLWWGAIVGTSIALSIPTRKALARLPRPGAGSASTLRPLFVAGVAIATISFGLIGLYGPDTTVMAVVVLIGCALSCTAMLTTGRDRRV